MQANSIFKEFVTAYQAALRNTKESGLIIYEDKSNRHKEIAMRVKSNENITNQKSQALKSKCTGIGNTTVELGGQTNLPAISAVVSLFSKNNGIYKSYRRVLHNDADHIRNIGAKFREFDRNLMR